MLEKICPTCLKTFQIKFNCFSNKKYCSSKCYHDFGHSDDTKQKMSSKKIGHKYWVGKKHTEESKEKMRISAHKTKPWLIARSISEQTRIKMSMRKTKESYFTGFRNSLNRKERLNMSYINWRNRVFKRDNYICQITHEHCRDLVVHHLNGFNKYKDLRYTDDNGITLKREVHEEFHSIYGSGNNTVEQFNEFKNARYKTC